MEDSSVRTITDLLRGAPYSYVRMLNHGLSNITAEIVDASGARFALKYYPRDTFKKEREEIFMSLARNFAPVPTYVGGGSNYSIMSLIDGNSGAVIFSQPQEESERVGMMIGQLIARVHTVNPQSGIVGFLSHRGNMIEEYGQRISTTRSNTTLLRSLIREQLAKLSQYNIQLPVIPIDSYICEKDDECVLVHHDVCPKNMLFRDGALVGMLDFEYALAGSRLFDIDGYTISRMIASLTSFQFSGVPISRPRAFAFAAVGASATYARSRSVWALAA